MNRLLLGTRKGLIQLQRASGGWQFERCSFEGVPVPYAMYDDRTDTLWASNGHGHWGPKLSRSRDGGRNWEEVKTPTYPEGSTVAPRPGSADGARPTPASLEMIWYIAPGGRDETGTLYLGTIPGGLFVSRDGGDSFDLMKTLWDHPSREKSWFGGGYDAAGICAIVVDPRDNKHLTVGVSCGGVFGTKDGGEIWQGRNKGLKAEFLPDPDSEYGHDPHYMTTSAGHPDVFWQQNHCGIFRSTDGAQSWHDVSQKEGPAKFGWVVCADANDAERAWVLPAASDVKRVATNTGLCVCRTDDGGKTWQDFREGLPQKNTYDIVYRHAMDQVGEGGASSHLAFGSTTGNVFASEDGGESWQSLGAHWPPVYSVRFAP